MSAVKDFVRRLSYRKPKTKKKDAKPNSATAAAAMEPTSPTAASWRLENNNNPSSPDSNVPFCLRQQPPIQQYPPEQTQQQWQPRQQQQQQQQWEPKQQQQQQQQQQWEQRQPQWDQPGQPWSQNPTSPQPMSSFARQPLTTSNTGSMMPTVSTDWIVEEIYLERKGKGLGFTIAGGTDVQDPLVVDENRSIYIKKIINGGIALEDGRLKQNDIILSVNGLSFVGVTHSYAVNALKTSGSFVRMTVKRRNTGATQPRIVDIVLTKLPGKGLGLNIAGGVGSQEVEGDNGIFITKIIRDGTADLDGRFSIGDKILSVDNIDMSNITHEQAVDILKSTSRQVRLVVAKCPPDSDYLTNGVGPMEVSRPVTTQQLSAAMYPTNYPANYPDTVVAQKSPNQNNSPPVHINGLNQASFPELVPSTMTDRNIFSFVKEPRQIVLKKPLNAGLGFNIVGGKDGAGIFISFIIPGGIADLNGELKKGDQLLKVNNVDLRDASHEEAAAALKAVGETALVTAQYRPEEYNFLEKKARELQQRAMITMVPTGNEKKSSVFVRALFDYDSNRDYALLAAAGNRGLSFSFGDILHVFNAAKDEDWWQARKVLPRPETESSGTGFIPSKHRVEFKDVSRIPKSNKSESDIKEELVPKEKKRRSFILSSKFSQKSKDKHHGENKDTTAASAADAAGNYEPVLSYEPVVQIQGRYARPVVIFGPLKDRINDDLIGEYPQHYSSCVPHTTRPMRRGEINGRDYHFVQSREQMERDIEAGMFAEAGLYNDHVYGMSFDAIKRVAEQNKHCILDVSVGALPRLHSADIYPISILIKPISATLISLWCQPISEESARKVYDSAVKLFQEYGKYFTAVVSCDSPEDVYGQIKSIIASHSQSTIWVPSNEKL